MHKTVLTAALLLISLPLSASAMDKMSETQSTAKWGPAPPAFPPGAQAMVLAGDPGKEGSAYVVRFKAPRGYVVPPHTHPADENVTVISGSFHLGMGDKLDKSKGETTKAGGFARVETGMHHYAWFTEPTVLQIHGIGPVVIKYLDPADDPRNKTNAKK